MLREFSWQFLRRFCRHPGKRRLLLFLDNELPDMHRNQIIRHLAECNRCHARMVQMEREWRFFAELNLASSLDLIEKKKLITKIQAAIQDLKSSPPQLPEKTEMDRQLAAVLDIYLGRRAAASLVQPEKDSAPSRGEKIAGAEAALLTLLGRKGFAAVEMRLHPITRCAPKAVGGPSLS